MFDERKTVVVYFYNSEVGSFIGPVYDSGPKFKREDCTKRYSIFGKQAIVVEGGAEQLNKAFVKETNLH